MEGIRIQGQTASSESAASIHRPVSTARRLANLVRRHGVTRGISLDATFRLETVAQRSWNAFSPWRQSIPRYTAALHSRTTLPLPLRPAGRSRLVETRTNRLMATGPLYRRC